MSSGPSRIAEAVVAFFVPPACREEVLGDLYERFTSPARYALEALRVVPLVVLSRIRRTQDPQILVIQAFALYVSFLSAAWVNNRGLLGQQWGLLRLAIPVAMALSGLILEDVYATPGRRSALAFARGPVLGLILALASQEVFRMGSPDLALPRWILLGGCAMSLLLSSAIRMWFPPATDQLQGAHAPAQWLKQAGGSGSNPPVDVRLLKAIFAVVTVAVLGAWMIGRAAPVKAVVPAVLLLAVAYFVWKQG